MITETDTDTAYRMRELRAELERRIEILERLQGRQGMARWLGPLLGVVALFLAMLVGTRTSNAHRLGTVAPSLEARTFVLKDVDGVERAKLGLSEDGGPSLTLTDASGRARLRLAVLSDGSPGVSLLDTDGESRAILGLLADGTTTLVFADRGAVARGVFAITPDGAARMIFNDANGVTRTAVGVDGTGASEISTISVESDGEGG